MRTQAPKVSSGIVPPPSNLGFSKAVLPAKTVAEDTGKTVVVIGRACVCVGRAKKGNALCVREVWGRVRH